jgi:hypothetical protein
MPPTAAPIPLPLPLVAPPALLPVAGPLLSVRRVGGGVSPAEQARVRRTVVALLQEVSRVRDAG